MFCYNVFSTQANSMYTPQTLLFNKTLFVMSINGRGQKKSLDFNCIYKTDSF